MANSSSTGPTKDFKIKLRSENPNPRLDIWYEEGGAVSLSVGQPQRLETIGVGNYPAFYNVHGETTSFEVVIHVSDNNVGRLRNKQLKIKAKGDVKLYLKMKVSARTEVGTWKTGSMRLLIACDITLDSFAKGTRKIKSKECHTLRET